MAVMHLLLTTTRARVSSGHGTPFSASIADELPILSVAAASVVMVCNRGQMRGGHGA
jgi:hypothetical protein